MLFFFFFSSRRRHTRFDCDWSSDVCSSDLPVQRQRLPASQNLISCSVGLGFCSRRAVEATRKPGVQMPHCSAASSRKACCRGLRPSRARPSTVVIWAPWTSAAMTQQELTRRPSMMTAQAPQLPLLQPSLTPTGPMRSRRASRRLSRSSARNSSASPLIVAWMMMRSLNLAPSCSAGRLAEGPLDEHRCEMLALLDGAAHVVDGPGGGPGGRGGGLDRLVRQRPGQDGVCGLLDQEAGGGDGADGDAGGGDVRAVEAEVRGGVDDGDVHLVAGGEALPGGAAPRGGGRELEGDDELARPEDVCAGAGVERLDGHAAAAAGAGDVGDG